jgi:O-antigen/teichoic acid export membrane protein
MQRVSAILNEVAFPAFASMQDDLERVAYHVLQAIRLTSLCSFPVFWGIGAVAPEIVDVLLGAKWAPSILPLQLMAIVMPLRMIAQLMPPTLQGVGNAKLTARNQLLTCGTMIAAFAIGVQYGIVGLSVAWLAAFPITFLVNLTTWLPALGIQASRVFAAIARPAAASAGMFALVGLARALGVGHGATALLTLVAIGAVGFVGLSLIVNRDELREAFSMVRRRSGS